MPDLQTLGNDAPSVAFGKIPDGVYGSGGDLGCLFAIDYKRSVCRGWHPIRSHKHGSSDLVLRR